MNCTCIKTREMIWVKDPWCPKHGDALDTSQNYWYDPKTRALYVIGAIGAMKFPDED